jgi:hypothetical protein
MSPGSRIQLVDSVNVIRQRINKAIAEKVNASLIKKRPTITNKLQIMIKRWVSAQPEMIELKTGGKGSLSSQLGLRAGTENTITNKIIDTIARSTHVDFKNVDSNLRKGGLILKCQLESFSDLLSMPEGFIEDNSSVGNLHWLQWLLTEGHRVIVVGYRYEGVSGFGRSHGGVMSEGGSWRVPPQYAGVLGDNFVTRALSNREKDIEKLLVEELRL